MKDYFNFYRDQIRYSNSLSIPSHPIICGYCGQNIAPHIGYWLYADTISSKKDMGYVYQCPLCKNPIIFFIDTKETIPGAPYGREIKNLPDNIQTLYNECRTCYANQCYTSAQMIARTLLMHIAVEQGAEEGLPFARYVTYLDEKGYIPPNGKKWVDYIRTSGNVANHEIVIKEREETQKVITFLSTLLLVIYELPNSLEAQTMTPEVKKRIEQIRQGIVPDGYTKTRSEITPTTWTPACLGDIYTERKEPGNESLPLLTVSIHSGVSDGELDEDELPKKVKRIEDKSQYKRAATGDLVFNMMRAWQGAIGTVRTEGMVSPAYIVAKPNGKVHPPFMDYYMKAPRMVGMINRQSYGVTDFRKRLYWDSFAPIPCVLPPVREQRKIAEILSTQDKAIELQARKIEELKRFKKGCLEKMFPRKGQKVPEKRFPGFTDDWEQRKLTEFVEFFSGLTYTPNDVQENGTLVLRSSNVSNGEVVDADNVYVNPQVVNSENVKVGDIVVVVRNGSRSLIGKHAQIKAFMPNTVIGAFMTGIRSECPEFTNALLNTSRFEEEIAMNMGATINQITGYMFSKMEFKVPCLDEQKEIGEYFENLDHLIALHQRKLEEMKRQKKALMQLLLTGIVRI